MPTPIPEGQSIQITHKKLEANYEMPSLQASQDHYSISYMLSGDRKIITPKMSFFLHAGYVGAMAPYIYHRTLPESNQIYESILIKFRPEFVKPLTDKFGTQILDRIYEQHANSFTLENQLHIQHAFEEILHIYQEDSIYSEFQLQMLLCELLLLIYTKREKQEQSDAHATELSTQITEAIYYLERNYTKDISITDVAKASGYSTAYFSRLFLKQVGQSYTDYLIAIRIRHVQDLLLNSNRSITDIALETGFKYPGNMTKCFKKITGLTPMEFRKKNV